MNDEREARLARQVTERAIRRLGVLEVALLGGALVLALVGGGLVALGLEALLGLPFRPIWAAASLLLFVIPGVVTLRQNRD